ncbi:MAG TPA: bifunctional adenosylcobinamide kinase/adenosylcobinamide-phosphate guanylyltransferase [Steroidobacteraceae bacterium]
MKTFLIGGARSGKSSLAARWANERSQTVCCVVTAAASDAEMTARIEAHRRERPPHWRVREEPSRLGAALMEECNTEGVVLIDCLTLWTANCLWPPAQLSAEPQSQVQADLPGWLTERDAFLASLRSARNEIIIVSNEVGTSLVPENAAARLFRDEQGRLNQLVAAACDSVFLVTAGLALRLK